MLALSLTLLTPAGLLLALAAAVPLAGLAFGERNVRAVRARLRLAPPADSRLVRDAVALASVCALLGLAAAQPALRTFEGSRVRTDAEALFVLDTSRSMAAAPSPGGRTRLARAQALAQDLRAAIPEVPSGLATLTDRLLPNLFPVEDPATFNSTVTRAIGIERPPPRSSEVVATTLAPLAGAATQGYFSREARRRVVVVLTDGESRPFDPGAVARAFERGRRTRLMLVHLWSGDERIYDRRGRLEGAYRPDARSRDTLAALASAAGTRVYSESDPGAGAALHDALGTGPTAERGRVPDTTPLGPWAAALALVPLALVLRRRNLGAGEIRLPVPKRRVGSVHR